MATHKTILAGVLGAFSLCLMAFGSTPALAYYDFCSEDSGLPCVYWSDNYGDGTGTYEASVEDALEAATGDIIDVMSVARVSNGDTYDNGFKLIGSGDSGYWKWYGDPDLLTDAYISVKAGTKYALFRAVDLIKYSTDEYVKGWWSTWLLYGKDLSHMALWKTVSRTQVSEPAPLALMLTGMLFLAWRRSRKAVAA